MENSIGIGGLAALVTVAGSTIYALGLIGIAIPIRRVFTGELSAAWYAVSLMPKTVVAGQGAHIWLRWPVWITVLTFLVGFSVQGIDNSGFARRLLMIVLLPSGFILLGYLAAVSRAGRLRGKGVIVIIYAVAVAGGMIITTVMLNFFPQPFFNPKFSQSSSLYAMVVTFTPASTLEALLFLFIGAFLIGLMPAVAAIPPLPEVHIIEQAEVKEIEGMPDPLQGYLVAHSDGFWHVFVVANEQPFELLSIPDERVVIVRLLGGAIESPLSFRHMWKRPVEGAKRR